MISVSHQFVNDLSVRLTREASNIEVFTRGEVTESHKNSCFWQSHWRLDSD